MSSPCGGIEPIGSRWAAAAGRAEVLARPFEVYRQWVNRLVRAEVDLDGGTTAWTVRLKVPSSRYRDNRCRDIAITMSPFLLYWKRVMECALSRYRDKRYGDIAIM